jgi:CheY-like chemotaxis protein
MSEDADEQGLRRTVIAGGASEATPALARAEARVAELERALERAAVARTELLSGLVHELRTPMTPMLTSLQMLEAEALSDRARRLVQVIHRNYGALLGLIDDVLELARLQRKALVLESTVVELGPVLERATAAVAPEAARRGVGLSLPPLAKTEVSADAPRLEQALGHTLAAAVRRSPEGSRVAVGLEAEAGSVRLVVEDEGDSLDAAAAAALFEPFARGREGAGVGLALARGLIEAHGGTLAVAPASRGARFSLTLPLSEVSASTALPGARPLRLLLVDDHEDSLALTRLMLERKGYDVVTARSATEALARASEQHFEVLVTDIGLPDESGLTILPAMVRRGPVVGIAVSGFGRDVDVARSKAAGYVQHLTKPVSIQRLHDVIQGFFH